VKISWLAKIEIAINIFPLLLRNMPKLLYFPVQGRAQAIRFLLAAKGVAFEDQRLTGAEWGPIKAAATYGEGAQMPIYVADDGSIKVQSMAILKSLAFEHGYMPETALQVYELEWFYAVVVDIIEKPERMALIRDEPSEEEVQACIALLKKFIEKIDGQWADGRAHAAGDKITHADFAMLALVTSMYENPNGKHAAIREATAA
jgi:glutathione S-transferase